MDNCINGLFQRTEKTQGDSYEVRRSKYRELVLFFIQILGIVAFLGAKLCKSTKCVGRVAQSL